MPTSSKISETFAHFCSKYKPISSKFDAILNFSRSIKIAVPGSHEDTFYSKLKVAVPCTQLRTFKSQSTENFLLYEIF